MESPLLLPEKKQLPYLGTFGIIKSTIEIPLRSYSFVILTFLTSLPFFFTILVPKLMPYSFLEGPYYYFSSESIISNDLIHDTALVLDFTTRTLKTCLFDWARFLLVITTVYSALKIHTSGFRPSTCLWDLLQHVITAMAKTKYWFGPITTFILITVFPDYTLDAFTYRGEWGPLVGSKSFFFRIVNGITYAGILAILLLFRALCHVGVVISILEEKISGFEALFFASAGLARGNWTRCLILMVLDMAWRKSLLRLPTLFQRWGFYDGVLCKVVKAYLVCVGMVMSWVVWVVYYYDCKNRQRGENLVEEQDGGLNEIESKD